MPHVDEGILHAYLDGALDAVAAAGGLPDGMQADDVTTHLALCDDCRARLETERDIRERAGLVLRDVAPPRVEVPPLAQLPAARRSSRRALPLAWAASLLLAVGAGWWGSEIARSTGHDFMTFGTEAGPAEAPASGASLDADADVLRASTEAVESAPAASSRMAEPRVSPMPAPPPAATPRTTEPTVSSAPAPPPAGERESRAAQQPAPAVAEAGVQMAEPLVTPLAPPAPPSRANAPLDVPDDAQSRRAAGAQPRLAQTVVAPIGVAAADSTPSSVETILMLHREGRLHARSEGSGRWSSMREVTVLEDAGTPSFTVYDYLGTSGIVEVAQRLDTGEQIELIAWREQPVELQALVVTGAARGDPAAPAAPPPPAVPQQRQESAAKAAAPTRFTLRRLEDDRHELVLRDGAAWIVLRARMTPGQLEALAARLTTIPAPPR